ncbi:hypothetical protein BGZ65_012823, partial [Modicella reniformis]
MPEPQFPSARLSYNEFEIAIKAFLKQAESHAPWSYVECATGGGQYLQGYLSMTQLVHSHQPSLKTSEIQPGSEAALPGTSTTNQLILDDLAEHFGDIPDCDEEDEVE